MRIKYSAKSRRGLRSMSLNKGFFDLKGFKYYLAKAKVKRRPELRIEG